MLATSVTRVFAVFALLMGLAFAISAHLYFLEHQFDTQLEILADDRLRVGVDTAKISQQTGQILKLAEALGPASPEMKSGVTGLLRSSLSESEESVRLLSGANDAAIPSVIDARRVKLLQALDQQRSPIDYPALATDYANAVQQFTKSIFDQQSNRYAALIQSEVKARHQAITLVLLGLVLGGLAMLYLYRTVIFRLLRLQSCMSAIIEGREAAIPMLGGPRSMARATTVTRTT